MARRQTVTFNLPSEKEELLQLRDIQEGQKSRNDLIETYDIEDDDEDDDDDDEEEERKDKKNSVLWYDVTDSDSLCSIQDYLESLAALRQLKNSLRRNRRTSSISTASAFIKEALQANDADDTWSLKYLRRRFERKDQETLFRSYQLRLQHVFLLVYLILQMLMSGVQVIALLYFIMNDKKLRFATPENIESFYIAELVARTVIFFVSCSLFLLFHKERSFTELHRFHLPLSVWILGTLFLSNFSISLYVLIKGEFSEKTVQFGNVIYILVVGYAFLPLRNNLYAILAGTTVSISYVTLCFFGNIRSHDPDTWQKVASDVIFLSMTNLVGIYSRYVNEITFRRVFLNRKGNLEAKIKLEKTKLQEEPLLLSVLPKRVMQMVREDYRRYINEGKLNSSQLFRNRYLSRHSNVSILYADIVNFTILTTKLEVDKLVEVLNDLFDQFDHVAEKNLCLRIKILGDCYYCVSGIPDSTPSHANNCIRMGLRMIDIIRKVRIRFQEDVNMRIGIHSGTVLCGIIGSLKFQYDVWGEDVNIANRMEQTGKVGRVHISGQTLSHVQNKEFEVEPYVGREADEVLLRKRIESYLVVPKKKRLSIRRCSNFNDEPGETQPMLSLPDHKTVEAVTSSKVKEQPAPLDRSMENDIHRCYKESMDGAIKSMPLKKTDQWFRIEDINPLLLTFTKEPWNLPMLLEKDLLFKLYLYFCLPVALGLTLLQEVLMPGITWSLIFGVIGFFLLLLIIVPSCYVSLFRMYEDKEEEDEINVNESQEEKEKGELEEHKCLNGEEGVVKKERILEKDHIQKMMLSVSQWMTEGVWVRTTLYFFCLVLLSLIAFANIMDCERIMKQEEEERQLHILARNFRPIFGTNDVRGSFISDDVMTKAGYLDFGGFRTTHIPPLCCNPWYFTISCVLVLLAAFGFLRTFFLIKLTAYLIITVAYSLFVLVFAKELFQGISDQCPPPKVTNLGLNTQNNHLVFVGVIVIALHTIDRQMEYFMRLNFKWRQMLLREQDEAEKARKVNETLLENIMPRHVAEYFLTRAAKQNLYHENHAWVAVIFASIPNFSDFYRSNRFGGGEDDDQGEKSLQVLNAIIIDFDELKVDPRFCSIEKIKVIGSTYMAACGLQLSFVSKGLPAAGNFEFKMRPTGRTQRRQVVNTLTSFAAAMFGKLEKVNEESWQNFGLRVGIDVGPVIAGVLGNQKPHYDIWGNAVNVASRMDTNGEIGKIHVTEEVAMILKDLKWNVEKRGTIFVKGKGDMVTYFVDPKSDPLLVEPKLSTDSTGEPLIRSILKSQSFNSKPLKKNNEDCKENFPTGVKTFENHEKSAFKSLLDEKEITYEATRVVTTAVTGNGGINVTKAECSSQIEELQCSENNADNVTFSANDKNLVCMPTLNEMSKYYDAYNVVSSAENDDSVILNTHEEYNSGNKNVICCKKVKRNPEEENILHNTIVEHNSHNSTLLKSTTVEYISANENALPNTKVEYISENENRVPDSSSKVNQQCCEQLKEITNFIDNDVTIQDSSSRCLSNNQKDINIFPTSSNILVSDLNNPKDKRNPLNNLTPELDNCNVLQNPQNKLDPALTIHEHVKNPENNLTKDFSNAKDIHISQSNLILDSNSCMDIQTTQNNLPSDLITCIDIQITQRNKAPDLTNHNDIQMSNSILAPTSTIHSETLLRIDQPIISKALCKATSLSDFDVNRNFYS